MTAPKCTFSAPKLHFYCNGRFPIIESNMEYSFTKERLAHFRKMSFDELSKLTFKNFTVTELKCLIAETPMKDEMKRASVDFYIKRETYQDVSFSLNVNAMSMHKSHYVSENLC